VKRNVEIECLLREFTMWETPRC